MKSNNILNKIIRFLQYALTSMIISSYVVAIIFSISMDLCLIKTYISSTAFIYYLITISKSPGSLLDANNATVKGICTKCNRIRGYQTKHCNICNKCYHKRDHHCILLGKCIAENNLKDFYYCLFFTLLYFLSMVFTKEYKLFYLLGTIGFGIFWVWMSFVIGLQKTSIEVLNMEEKPFNIQIIRNLYEYLKENPLNIFFPFLKVRNVVELE
ncbi:hypothetical protein NUSPORA_01796 [Nucleospora cyclopteri]